MCSDDLRVSNFIEFFYFPTFIMKAPENVHVIVELFSGIGICTKIFTSSKAYKLDLTFIYCIVRKARFYYYIRDEVDGVFVSQSNMKLIRLWNLLKDFTS